MTHESRKENNTMARLAELARIALQSEANLARRTLELTRAMIRGEVDRTETGRAYAEAFSREGARYWRRVGDLGIDFATDLTTLGKDVTSRVLDETAGSARAPHGFGRATSQPSTGGGGTSTSDARGDGTSLRLRGPLGGRVEGAVTVSNQHPRARRVQLSGTELTGALGAGTGASLEITPYRITVPAHEQRAIAIAADLDPEHFRAGGRYTCAIEITGGDEATVDVTVEVTG